MRGEASSGPNNRYLIVINIWQLDVAGSFHYGIVGHSNTYRKDLIMYPQITLHANKLDVTLLKAALNDLLDKVLNSGDTYHTANNVKDLLTQLDEMEI